MMTENWSSFNPAQLFCLVQFRFETPINVGGNGRRNFDANVGGHTEYDIPTIKNDDQVVGSVEGSQSFRRVDGHKYNGKL